MNLVDVQQLLNAVARTPSEVSRLVNVVPQEHWRIRPAPEEFSVLESVCHLRDIEVEGYAQRIARILNETKPTLTDVDGARLAIERDYNTQELAPALEMFCQTRERNVALLRTLAASEFDRQALLEGAGEITLRKLVVMMNEHDEGHLDELGRISNLRFQLLNGQ
jgi:DinB superfamily